MTHGVKAGGYASSASRQPLPNSSSKQTNIAPMHNNNNAVSTMARHYVPETMAETQARRMRDAREHIGNVLGDQVCDDWRPGQPLRFRRKAVPHSRKEWRPMTYEMKRALINAKAAAVS